jgi:hypothetical protein
MAVITSGKTFANGEQLSADKLNQVITAATFNASDAVDGSTMTLVGGAMAVRDTGITTAKIADSNVTKAKIENVANMKVLGNTSGSAASPQEVAILDEDNMTSDSATSLATQQSIKAFAGMIPAQNGSGGGYASEESITFPNGLIMKFGSVSASGSSDTDITFGSAFNATVSAQITEVKDNATATGNVYIRTLSSSVLRIRNNATGTRDINWLVFGR